MYLQEVEGLKRKVLGKDEERGAFLIGNVVRKCVLGENPNFRDVAYLRKGFHRFLHLWWLETLINPKTSLFYHFGLFVTIRCSSMKIEELGGW